MTDSTRHSSWTLAVDFGTSSTAAAIGRDGGAELVGVDGGLPRMLSNVFWQESTGRLLLGDMADAASALAPWCFERTPKVKLGQQFMLLGDHRMKVSEAVGAVLSRVASDAIRVRGGERPAVVRLTHPVRWGDEKRDALLEAASLAGLDHPEPVLEPVAAARHYAHERLGPGEHVAVYDLGGGTLDTAVLQCTDSGFEVIGEPRGRDGFGGEDFDHRLYRFLGAQLPEEDWLRMRSEPEQGADNAWPKANRQFQRNVRRAKELLTHNPQVDVDVPPPVNRGLVLTVTDLEDQIRLDVEDSVRELERTIHSAGLEPTELAAIYLAGGSSQIPLVARTIHERLGVMPEHLNDSKAVICLGAALGVGASQPQQRRPLRDSAIRAATEEMIVQELQPADLTEPGATVRQTERQAEPVALTTAGATEPSTAQQVAPAGPRETGATEQQTERQAEPVTLGTAGATEQQTERQAEPVALTTAGATEQSSAQQVEPADLTETGATEQQTERQAEPVALTSAGATEQQTERQAEPVALTSAGATEQSTARSRKPANVRRTLLAPLRSAISTNGFDRTAVEGDGAVARPQSRRNVALVGAGLAALVIIAVVVVLLTSGTSGKSHANPASTSSGPLTIAFAPPWRLTQVPVAGSSAVAAALPTFGTNGSAVARPIQLTAGQVTLAAGLLKQSAPIPGGAPPQLVAQYGKPASTTNARAAGASATEYTWNPAGKVLAAYVVPTSVADVALICQAPSQGIGLPACTQLVDKAAISGVELLPPGPDRALASLLNKRLAPVASARAALRRLGGSNLSSRAGPATRVAIAETAAASAVAANASVPRYSAQVAALVTALRKESSAFTALASAARSGNRRAYSVGVRAVTAASASLSAATQALAGAGLSSRVLTALHLAGPPAAPTSPPSNTPSPSSGSSSSGSSPSGSSPSGSSPSGSPAPSSPAPSSPAPSPPAQQPCTQNCSSPGA